MERTLDEAIERELKIADSGSDCWKHCSNTKKHCKDCMDEHRQNAEWLKELKDYRDKNKLVIHINVENIESIKDKCIELAKEQYNKAIDDFAEILKDKLVRKYANSTPIQQYVALQVTNWCNEIAEQLKAGESDEE